MKQHQVYATQHKGNLIESYYCAPGPPEGVSRHTHETYQLCLTEGVACRYVYRGSNHLIPKSSLCVLHPGEPHETEDAEERPPGTIYRMLYLEPDAVLEATKALGISSSALPFFRNPIVEGRDVLALLQRFFGTLGANGDETESEVLFHAALETLISRYAGSLPKTKRLPRARPEVASMVAFLNDHSDRRVTLDELSQVTGLSVYHVSRLFRQETGLAPYTFHLQLRVARAKTLIVEGNSIVNAALTTGFYDQSQLNKHFRRFVGTTPSHYKKAKFA